MLNFTRATRSRTDQGATAVEFALIMPILFTLIFALIQYGLYFWSWQGGSDAARSAARAAATGQYTDCTQFKNYVKQNIDTMGQAGTATITRSYASGPAHIAGDTAIEVGDTVTVTLSYKSFDFHFPFVPFIRDGVVRATAISRVESVPDATVGACS